MRLRTRGLRLTPSGRQLAQDIKVLLEHADSLYESARGLATSLVGELKVGVFAPLAPFRLPAILQTFEGQHPGVEVSFLEADLASLQTALLEGQCDVALTYGLGLGRASRTRCWNGSPRMCWSMPGIRRVPARRTIALKELDGEPSVVLDLPHSREYSEQLYTIAGVVPMSGTDSQGMKRSGHSWRRAGYAVLNQRLHSDLTYSGGRWWP